MRYLIMDGNRVANVVVWDGETPWQHDAPVEPAPDGVGPGFTRNPDGSWTPPPPPEPEPELEG